MTFKTRPLTAAALLACLCAAGQAQAQIYGRRTGQVGDRSRIRVVVEEAEQDADELHARAEALEREGKRQEARAAFAAAIKQHLIAYRAETSSGRVPTPEWKDEEKAAWRARAAGRLKRAAESARRYLLLGEPESEIERSNLSAIAAHAELLGGGGSADTAFFPFEVDARAQIRRKPEPGFTEEARERGVNGYVLVRAVLSHDGVVRHVLVLKGLPHGISEKCVEAALRTEFEPATKEGRPVSQFVTLEYNFRVF